jgi:hypothetical protein
MLSVEYKAKAKRLWVEIKPNLHSAIIHRLVELEQLRPPTEPILIVSELVSPNIAEVLRRANLNFLDAAGNANLSFGDLQVFVTGKRRKISMPDLKRGRVLQRNGLVLVFAFLTDPELDRNPRNALLNQPLRRISEQAGLSLGSIGQIIGELEEQGYVIEESSRERLLIDRRKLLEKWMTGYTELLRPRLRLQKYRSPSSEWWRSARADPDNALWGGEVASAKMTDYLKPEIYTLYSKGLKHDFIIRNDLRVSQSGDVEVLRPFWGNLQYAKWDDCTHPLLTYADLIGSNIERNLETAQRVYDKFLRPVFYTNR